MSDPTPVPAIRSELDLGEDFGWALGVLLRSYRDRVADALGTFPHGPRGYEVMAEVLRGKQPSQLTLANHLGIDRTVMTYLIDDLESEGFVERRPNPADRRQRLIVATAHGRDVVESACRQVVAAEQELLGSLDDGERGTLRRLLHKAAAGTGEHVEDPCAVADE